jgi:murein DD-endopeptidase MepM/ murein hydrolase activator NlpD
MSLTTKYGILAGPQDPTQTDLNVFASLGFGAVKLMCGLHSPSAIAAYRDHGAYILQARIYYPQVAQGSTPAQFVNARRDAIAAFIDAGLGEFEVLNEPNLSREGFGASWTSGDGFNNWFQEALNLLRQAFPSARFGFPGLSPHPADFSNDPAVNRPLRPVGDLEFLEACNYAVLAADYLCTHAYWQNVEQMRDLDSTNIGKGGLRWIRYYHERFPTLPIVVSEFCNNRPGIGDYAPGDAQWRVIGDEYAEFITLCAQYPWVQAVFARTLRDPSLPDQSWLTNNFEQRRIIEGVKARPPIPEPNQLRLRWPTQFRKINQDYGMRQSDYLRYSSGWLHGGHEGVDIAAPEGTDIYSALDGTVVRSEASSGNFAGGYGAYGEVISVESYVPNVGKVSLTYAHLSRRLVGQGAFVRAGDRLGFAGHTGNAQGAHLHLSMRIAGVALAAQLDYLNGGLYLNFETAPEPPPAVAIGSPRVQYARTVVLLPPPAGLDYVEAVLRATWDINRYTVGGSADDGGIGDLDQRRVIAVNPQQWNGDLPAWYSQNYPGIDYVPVFAATPSALQALLRSLNLGPQPVWTGINRGKPREQYARTVILLPPPRGLDWALTAARITWAKYRVTIGGSSDDGGIGALSNRRVVALNPHEWGGDLQAWYTQYYPGVTYSPVIANDLNSFAQQLAKLFP